MVHVSDWSAYAPNTWERPAIAFKEPRKSRKDLDNYLVILMLVVMGTSTGDRNSGQSGVSKRSPDINLLKHSVQKKKRICVY